MGWNFHGSTISDLMAKTIRAHLDLPKPDAVLNIETHLFNVTLEADSCEYDLDVGKHLWLNKQRWSRLMREYVPREPLERFIDQAVEILSGEARLGATANMMFRDPDRYAKKHRWGGCIMGATFRGDNRKAGKATLTFYSRTTYIGYMGLLDAAIGNRIAAAIAKRFAAKLNEVNESQIAEPVFPKWGATIAFRWHISSMQLHCFKTLPYIYSQSDLMQRLEKYAKQKRAVDALPPTWKHISKWYAKVTNGWAEFRSKHRGAITDEQVVPLWLDTEKYGPFRRIKRRWCEFKKLSKKHVPPSLPVHQLDFSKCE